MLSIGEFSKICQVSAKTLRYYDEIGLLRPEEINPENGYRYYRVEQLERMLFINRLKSYHFSLEEIKRILGSDEAQAEMLCQILSKRKSEMEKQMRQFQNTLDQLGDDIDRLQEGKSMMTYMDEIDVGLADVPLMNLLSMRSLVRDYEFADAYGTYFGRLFSKNRRPAVDDDGAANGLVSQQCVYTRGHGYGICSSRRGMCKRNERFPAGTMSEDRPARILSPIAFCIRKTVPVGRKSRI